jgi:hypothetical protein
MALDIPGASAEVESARCLSNGPLYAHSAVCAYRRLPSTSANGVPRPLTYEPSVWRFAGELVGTGGTDCFGAPLSR